MAIYAIRGLIEEFAPIKSEAVAVYARDGFASLKWIWDQITSDRNTNLIFPTDLANVDQREPWRNKQDTFWEISPHNGVTRYYYSFSNPSGKRLVNIDQIDQLINRSLDHARLMKIKSIAYVIIPIEEDDQRISARRMLQTIRNWQSVFNYELDIYLVDRVNGFEEVLNE
jgi:hypothetical protein